MAKRDAFDEDAFLDEYGEEIAEEYGDELGDEFREEVGVFQDPPRQINPSFRPEAAKREARRSSDYHSNDYHSSNYRSRPAPHRPPAKSGVLPITSLGDFLFVGYHVVMAALLLLLIPVAFIVILVTGTFGTFWYILFPFLAECALVPVAVHFWRKKHKKPEK